MPDTPSQIGDFSVDCEIGRGGMGVVYKATDSRLGRSVAIKALPAHLADDPERMARFEREARTLAALNHPNVGGIHGIEEHAVYDPLADQAATVGFSDTSTTPGTILGSVQYMSPEQARGGAVDRRTDLWAPGVVLYECLSGVNPFSRESPGECMAAIFSGNPDLTALPGSTPAEVVALVGRCLRTDVHRRQRDAGDCRLILEDCREALSKESPAASRALEISDRQFRISDELCRSLDRDGFDAMLPGWEMQYADNNRESDALVLWIPSIGGDHTTSAWRELIAAAPYRMVVVCPVGMEPGVTTRPVVSIENQLALIRALTGHLRGRLNPRRTIVAGFACGSIMALRCAAGDESGELFDGVLAIDMMHLDDACLGRRFTDDVLQFIPVPGYLGLMGKERLLEQLASIDDAVLS